MRFALRNQDKIANAFDQKYVDLLLLSLKNYFDKHKEIEVCRIQGESHDFIFVPNAQEHTDSLFQFAVIRITYDVYNLAYYSALS